MWAHGADSPAKMSPVRRTRAGVLLPTLLLVATAALTAAATNYEGTQVFVSGTSCSGYPDAVTFVAINGTCATAGCTTVADLSGASTSRVCTTSTATYFFASYAVYEVFDGSPTCATSATETFAGRLATCVPFNGSFVQLACPDVMGTTVTVTKCADAACSTACTQEAFTSGTCVAGVRYTCPPIYVESLWFWVAIGGVGLVVLVTTISLICCCRRRRLRKSEDEAFGDVVRGRPPRSHGAERDVTVGRGRRRARRADCGFPCPVSGAQGRFRACVAQIISAVVPPSYDGGTMIGARSPGPTRADGLQRASSVSATGALQSGGPAPLKPSSSHDALLASQGASSGEVLRRGGELGSSTGSLVDQQLASSPQSSSANAFYDQARRQSAYMGAPVGAGAGGHPAGWDPAMVAAWQAQ